MIFCSSALLYVLSLSSQLPIVSWLLRHATFQPISWLLYCLLNLHERQRNILIQYVQNWLPDPLFYLYNRLQPQHSPISTDHHSILLIAWGGNGVRLDSSLTLHTQIIRNSVKSTWNMPRNWAVLTISTVFRMIQIIISSWTYSNSYLSCLPAPTIAYFHSALNILSIQSDPVKRYIKWCYSSAQSLTASLLPHTFHYQQEPCFLKWPTRPYIMWDSVNLFGLISNSCPIYS